MGGGFLPLYSGIILPSGLHMGPGTFPNRCKSTERDGGRGGKSAHTPALSSSLAASLQQCGLNPEDMGQAFLKLFTGSSQE